MYKILYSNEYSSKSETCIFQGKKKALIVSFIFYYSKIYWYYLEKHYYSIPTVSIYWFLFIHLGSLCHWLLTSW